MVAEMIQMIINVLASMLYYYEVIIFLLGLMLIIDEKMDGKYDIPIKIEDWKSKEKK